MPAEPDALNIQVSAPQAAGRRMLPPLRLLRRLGYGERCDIWTTIGASAAMKVCARRSNWGPKARCANSRFEAY